MKLNRYDKSSFSAALTPFVSISYDGKIKISPEAVREGKIAEGDKFEISQDADDSNTWYLLRNNEHGWEAKRQKGKGDSLTMQSKAFARLFHEWSEVDKKTNTVRLSLDTALITVDIEVPAEGDGEAEIVKIEGYKLTWDSEDQEEEVDEN